MTQIKTRVMNQNGGYDKYIRPSLAQVQNELGLYGGPGGSCPTAPADKVPPTPAVTGVALAPYPLTHA
eukprot:4066743-Prymnesium_polylepis.1